MANLVLPFSPDALTFQLEWLTSVHRCSEDEYRQSHRDVPRATVTWRRFYEIEEYNPILNGFIKRDDVPLIADWRYAQRPAISGGGSTLTVDESLLYVEAGGTIILCDDEAQYEVHTVVTVVGGVITLTSPTSFTSGVWFLQAFEVTVTSDPSVSIEGVNTVAVVLQGVINAYPDLSSKHVVTPTMQSVYIRTSRDLRAGTPNTKVDQGRVIAIPPSGPVEEADRFALSRESRFIASSVNTPSGIMAEEAFFHYLAGRAIPFWQSSWFPDYVTTLLANSGTNTLRVGKSFTGDAIPAALHDLVNDAHYEVTNSADLGAELELTVSPVLANTIQIGSSFARMGKYRLSGDAVTLRMESAFRMQYSISTTEAP